MNQGKLTRGAQLARTPDMRGNARKGAVRTLATTLFGSLALGGCITVNAPEEPIVIELNVNIRQEVIYRLAEDAGNTIDENADIF